MDNQAHRKRLNRKRAYGNHHAKPAGLLAEAARIQNLRQDATTEAVRRGRLCFSQTRKWKPERRGYPTNVYPAPEPGILFYGFHYSEPDPKSLATRLQSIVLGRGRISWRW